MRVPFCLLASLSLLLQYASVLSAWVTNSGYISLMGNICTDSNKTNLVCATLNFSGICLSPFQYHDCSVEKDYMSEKFRKIMEKYGKKGDFSWKVGEIDKKLQVERYSPIYNKNSCVENGQLVDRATFQKKWIEAFEKNRHHMKENQPTEEMIKQCLEFDWIAYEAMIAVVYEKSPKDEVDMSKVKEFNPKQFQNFLKEWHSKTYLNNEKKMERVMDFLKKDSVDVIFMQETEVRGNLTWEKHTPETYGIVTREGTESMILYRKEVFPSGPDDKAFEKKEWENINFNKDTVFVRRGNYLLISGHLTSKAKNVEQAKEMFVTLDRIRKENPGLEIILGIDSNHFMDPALYPGYSFIPNQEKMSTTSKKRTWMQLQTNKANVIVMETKDHLVSTLREKHHFIGMINGNWIDEKIYLPCDAHPFDHFVVCAELVKPHREPPQQK